ncbi:MAG: site-2 protease family protein [Patescibacteria group bacterium]
MYNYLFSNPLIFFLYLFALLVAITIHEFSHAYMADHLGDPTPRLQGRLKLNPMAHLDWLGMVFLLLFGFGWGKPVEFDPYNLKNPRKDAAVISIAGPISNFIMAIILSIILRLLIFFDLNFLTTIGFLLLTPVIRMNIILGVFNLLPIHPLDGFKIVGGFLSNESAREWYSLQRYGMFFLLLMIFPIAGTSMLERVLSPVVSFMVNILIPMSLTGVI